MTVNYTAEVANSSGFGSFLKLLRRWRGSIYKLIWRDLLAFLSIYYALSLIYLFALNESAQDNFESLVAYCNNYSSLIPLSFVLGFYVTIVMQRWWDQYTTIPWPDPIAVFVSANVHGQDERGRVMRRTVMRYVCTCLTIVFTQIAPRVKRRFPTLDSLVEAGLLLENEKHVMEDLARAFPKYPLYWLPIVWAASIITRARKEGRIRDDFSVKTIIDALNFFRGNCGVLLFYDSISVPLVYTQVVTLAVYTYFLCEVIGHQWTKKDNTNYVDLYFPIFTTLQFFFYMGWLKVAETLINPFGEDDDDFEVNWMIDRNLQVSYLIVDEMHHEHPELVRDQYWDEVFPNELPYQAENKREEPPESSTAHLDYTKSTQSVTKFDGVTTSTRLDENGSQVRLSETKSRIGTIFQRLIARDTMSKDLPTVTSDLTLDAEKQRSTQTNGNVPTMLPPQSVVRLPSVSKPSGTVRIVDERTDALEKEDKTLPQQSMSTDSDERLQQLRDSSANVQVTFEDIEEEDEEEQEEDEFERLREERERERIVRQRWKFARGIRASTNLSPDIVASTTTEATLQPQADAGEQQEQQQQLEPRIEQQQQEEETTDNNANKKGENVDKKGE